MAIQMLMRGRGAFRIAPMGVILKKSSSKSGLMLSIQEGTYQKTGL